MSRAQSLLAQLTEIEDLANAELLSNAEVRHFETSMDEARELGAIAFFGDKYGEPVHSSMYRNLWSNGPKEALEFAADDECVEVTPEAIRIRKVILGAQERFRDNARRRRAGA